MSIEFDDPEQILHQRKASTLEEEVKNWDTLSFNTGFCGGGLASWLATPRLSPPLRVGLSLGVACVTSFWLLLKSTESRYDRILSMRGSPEHSEVATKLLRFHDRWALSLLSKHYFPEEVYHDSSVDRPIHVWRYKNSFIDPLARFQSTFSGQGTDSKENNIKKTTMVAKQVDVSAGDNGIRDQFDSILGPAENAEDVPQLETPKALSRREKRRLRWSRRRHRLEHDDKETDI